jgi:hypothetical protein
VAFPGDSRWVPIVSLAVLPTFFMENAGPVGLLTQVPVGVAATAVGWYAWRRS